MLRTCLLLLLVLASSTAFAAERWQTLPDPPLVAMARHGHVQFRGASLYYASTGNGSPVLLLHGSLGSSDDWATRSARWPRTTPSSSWTVVARVAARMMRDPSAMT